MVVRMSGRSFGFSIVELMFVVVIITVLATIAAPTFTGTQRSDHLVNVTHRIHAALELARSRALLKGSAVRIIIRPDAAGIVPNVRVDESWNTNCAGWAAGATQFNPPNPAEADVNADCAAWTVEQRHRCGVARVDVTNDLVLPIVKESGIKIEPVRIGPRDAGGSAPNPLVLCVNRRGRLLMPGLGGWVAAAAPGEGVQIDVTRTEGGSELARKTVWIGQGGVPLVLR